MIAKGQLRIITIYSSGDNTFCNDLLYLYAALLLYLVKCLFTDRQDLFTCLIKFGNSDSVTVFYEIEQKLGLTSKLLLNIVPNRKSNYTPSLFSEDCRRKRLLRREGIGSRRSLEQRRSPLGHGGRGKSGKDPHQERQGRRKAESQETTGETLFNFKKVYL